MICDRRDVAPAGQPSPDASVDVLDRAILPGRGGIAEPRLCADLGLQVRPANELSSAVEGDGFPGQVGQVACGLHDLAHHQFRALVRILQKHREPADTLDQRCHIGLPKALFEQHKVSLPVSELAAVSNIVRAEQDADVAIELRRHALSGAPGFARFAMVWQIPPQVIRHAFFGIDVTIDRFPADPEPGALENHPIADLFGRPAIL